MKYRILQDQANSINLIADFGIDNSHYVRHLDNSIKSTIKTDYTETIGLFGEWGSGKSTIIQSVIDQNNKLKNKIHNKELRFHVYDAWKYSAYDFRSSILLDIAGEKKKSKITEDIFNSKSSSKQKFNFNATRIFLIVAPLIAFILLMIFDVTKIFPSDVNTFYSLFILLILEVIIINTTNFLFQSETVQSTKVFSQIDYSDYFQKLVKNTGVFNVIVIDNLDRCSEDYSLSVLDFVKGFLSNKKGDYVFVIPVDENRVIDELKKTRQYNRTESKEYLNKVFDYIIKIEKYSKMDIHTFTKKISEKEKFGFSDTTINLISSYYGETPRKVIKMINMINSKREVIEMLDCIKEDDINVDFITKIVLLRELWSDIYAQVVNDPYNMENILLSSNSKTEDKKLQNFKYDTRSIKVENNVGYLFETKEALFISDKVHRMIIEGNIKSLLDEFETRMDTLVRLFLDISHQYINTKGMLNLEELYISCTVLLNQISKDGITFEELSYTYSDIMEHIINKDNGSIDEQLIDLIDKSLDDVFSISVLDESIRKANNELILTSYLYDSAKLLKSIINIVTTEYLQNYTDVIQNILIRYFRHDESSSDTNPIIDFGTIKSFIDVEIASFALEFSRYTYIIEIYKTNPELFIDLELKLQEKLPLQQSDFSSMSYKNAFNYIYRLELLNTVIRSDSEISSKIYAKLSSLSPINYMHTLLTQYTPSEKNDDFILKIVELFFNIVHRENYRLNSNHNNFMSYLFDVKNYSKFLFLYDEALTIIANSLVKGNALISLFHSSKFEVERLKQVVEFVLKDQSDSHLDYLGNILNNKAFASSGYYFNTSVDTDSIRDNLIEILKKNDSSALLKLVSVIEINPLVSDVRLQGLINTSNEFKKIMISKAKNYNDLAVLNKTLTIRGVTSDYESKLIEILANASATDIKELDADNGINITLGVKKAIDTRLRALSIDIDSQEYTRITK